MNKNIDQDVVNDFGEEWDQWWSKSGLSRIEFSHSTPYWVAVGYKK